MKQEIDKTNVMRILDQKKILYNVYHYESSEVKKGVEAAHILNIDDSRMYKTLVTVSKSKEHYVFVIPVSKELDLKKAAKVANEKNIEMIPQKELLPLTGYVHGGCSPIGMKKYFKTFIDSSALNKDMIIFSGGKIAHFVEVKVEDINKVINVKYEDITK